MSITIGQAIKQAMAMAGCIGKNAAKYELLAATNAAGLIKPRIHNDGKDANGNSLGGYSPGYAKTRLKRGRQIAKKDLQFTDQLFNSEQIFKVNGSAVFGIKPGKRSRDKISNQRLAVLLEENEKKEIFFASAVELKKITKTVDKAMLTDLDKCFNRF